MLRRLLVLSLLVLMAVAVIPAGGAGASGAGGDQLSRVNHIVVIYQENHSFDNLYGMWEGVRRPARRPAGQRPPRSTRPAPRTSACSRTTST